MNLTVHFEVKDKEGVQFHGNAEVAVECFLITTQGRIDAPVSLDFVSNALDRVLTRVWMNNVPVQYRNSDTDARVWCDFDHNGTTFHVERKWKHIAPPPIALYRAAQQQNADQN